MSWSGARNPPPHLVLPTTVGWRRKWSWCRSEGSECRTNICYVYFFFFFKSQTNFTHLSQSDLMERFLLLWRVTNELRPGQITLWIS